MERWICETGRIVLAKAGRDAGRFFVVIGTEGSDLLLADGERRTLAKPKRKNPAHVQRTEQTADPMPQTDRALRTVLRVLNEKTNQPQTKFNQVRKEVIDDVETGCN
ncbi:MAG: KOW domain-containing RNA-binding protein [Oscillospiraceae bacterium]|nr:KOW domain-containing RNA-binding protein [Oscillospiraceae bacterium]